MENNKATPKHQPQPQVRSSFYPAQSTMTSLQGNKALSSLTVDLPNTNINTINNTNTNTNANSNNFSNTNIQSTTKLKSISKMYNSDSTFANSQDNKLLCIKTLKAAIAKFPIITHKETTGLFHGFAGYSFKNSRKFNEDKLDININYFKGGKLISLYSIYDGHGGDYVSNYLKDHLHKELISNEELLIDSKKTILRTYEKIESSLLSTPVKCYTNQCGACSLLLVNVDNTITIANLGDSRGIISLNHGEKIHSISIDHKMSNETEKQRIIASGGVIKRINAVDRVFPSGLSVSRSFGDSDMKSNAKYNPIIISIPDILSFDYKSDMDFILLGSDGLFESTSNKDIALCIYNTLKRSIEKHRTYAQLLEKVIYNINKKMIIKGIKDNLTGLFLPFEFYKALYDAKDFKAIEKIIAGLKSSLVNGERIYEDISNGYLYKYTNSNGNVNGNGIGNCNGNIISLPSGGLEAKKKSTIIQQNIRLYESSFTKSNISIEGKRNTSQMPPISELETSDTEKNDKNKHNTHNKSKERKSDIFCCGLFNG